MLARQGTRIASLVLLLGVGPAVWAQPAATAARRIPLPADAEVAKAVNLVREVFADEYKGAVTSAKKKLLADQLLAEALNTKDDLAGQCALFREARNQAVAAGDVKTSLSAVDEMARIFEFDELVIKSKTLLSLNDPSGKPSASQELAEAAMELLDESVRADQFVLAQSMGSLAATAALRARALPLSQHASRRVKEIEQLSAAFAQQKEALATLAKDADDTQANLVVGKYLCFLKGDWDAGLRHLAKGGDAELKALALQDLSESTDSSDQVNIGDAWWAKSEGQTTLARSNLAARSVYWYEQAIPNLGGLARAKIEKRLEEAKGRSSDRPASPSRWIRLLPLVDVKRDKVRGTWDREREGLSGKNHALLQLPYQPPEEYDMRYSFTRTKGNGGVGAKMVLAGRQLNFGLGWWDDNSHAGFEYLDRKQIKQSPFSVPYSLKNGQKYDVLLQVRKTGVQALVNGKPLVACKTDGSNITEDISWRLPKPTLGLITKDTTVFHSIEVRDVTGKGTVLK